MMQVTITNVQQAVAQYYHQRQDQPGHANIVRVMRTLSMLEGLSAEDTVDVLAVAHLAAKRQKEGA